jgi:hypothetical protein
MMSEPEKLKVEAWPIDRLIPYENNSKKHPKEQVKKIASSIREFGWNSSPIEVDTDNVIINGHGRRLAAISLNMKKVPVVVRSDLTNEQVRAYRLADNETARSEYDTGLLSNELKDLHLTGDFDMSMFFDERDLTFATDDLGDMNLDALTADIQDEVEAQRQDIADKAQKAKGRKFPINEVLGFNKVSNEHRMIFSRLVAVAESETGLAGVEAVTSYLEESCL